MLQSVSPLTTLYLWGVGVCAVTDTAVKTTSGGEPLADATTLLVGGLSTVWAKAVEDIKQKLPLRAAAAKRSRFMGLLGLGGLARRERVCANPVRKSGAYLLS
jgi:hypothetical protein